MDGTNSHEATDQQFIDEAAALKHSSSELDHEDGSSATAIIPKDALNIESANTNLKDDKVANMKSENQDIVVQPLQITAGQQNNNHDDTGTTPATNRRKCYEKEMARSGSRASKPGVVSVTIHSPATPWNEHTLNRHMPREPSSGNMSSSMTNNINSAKEAAALDRMISERSLMSHGSTTSREDRKPRALARAITPGALSASSETMTRQQLSRSPADAASSRPPGFASGNHSSAREAEFLDHLISQRSPMSLMIREPTEVMPETSSSAQKCAESTEREQALKSLDARISQRSLLRGNSTQKMADKSGMEDQPADAEQGALVGSGRKADEKGQFRSKRALKPGVESVSHQRVAQSRQLHAPSPEFSSLAESSKNEYHERNIRVEPLREEGSKIAAGQNDKGFREMSETSGSMGASGLETLSLKAPPRAKSEIPSVTELRREDSDGKSIALEGQDLLFQAKPFSRPRRSDEKSVAVPRATKPGVSSVTSHPSRASSRKLAPQDSNGSTNVLYETSGSDATSKQPPEALRNEERFDASSARCENRTEGRKSDAKTRQAPRATKPGATSVTLPQNEHLEGDRKLPAKNRGKESRTAAEPSEVSSIEEASILDQKISKRSFGITLDTPDRDMRNRFWESASSFQSIPEEIGCDNDSDSVSIDFVLGSMVTQRPGAESRSGAISVVSSTSSLGMSRADLDADVQAKQRARYPPRGVPSSTSFSSLGKSRSDLDADVAAKQQALNGTRASPSTADLGMSFSSLGGSMSELNADIAAKQRARPGSNGIAPHRSLEEGSKPSLERNPSERSARSGLVSQISSRFRLQRRNRGDSRRVLTTLDDRIANKVASFGFTRPVQMVDVGAKQEKDKQKSQELSSQFAPENDCANNDDIQYGEFGGTSEEGLAVAFAVEEEAEDTYLPAAIEFDPDAKPAPISDPRVRRLIFILNVVVVSLVLGSAFGLKIAGEKTKAGIPYRETLGIEQQLVQLFGSTEFAINTTSPSAKALRWITHDDRLSILPNNTHFVQRFLMARLYFETTEEHDWDGGCTPPEDGIGGPCFINRLVEYDGQALLEFARIKRYMTEPGVHWLSDAHECEWAGVHCDDLGQVRRLELSK